MSVSDLVNILPIVATILLTTLSALIVLLYQFRNTKDIDKELKPVREERIELRKRLNEPSSETIIDTIQLGLNQLTEYYVINKGQARNSFRASLTLIALGFLTITFGIWSFFIERSPNFTLSAISTISGVLLQFIGGASFFVYRKSLEQLNYFFNQLIRMQDTMLAIQLTKELPDQGKHLELMETLIIALIERSSNIVVSAVTKTKTRKPSNNHLQPTNHHPAATQSLEIKD